MSICQWLSPHLSIGRWRDAALCDLITDTTAKISHTEMAGVAFTKCMAKDRPIFPFTLCCDNENMNSSPWIFTCQVAFKFFLCFFVTHSGFFCPQWQNALRLVVPRPSLSLFVTNWHIVVKVAKSPAIQMSSPSMTQMFLVQDMCSRITQISWSCQTITNTWKVAQKGITPCLLAFYSFLKCLCSTAAVFEWKVPCYTVAKVINIRTLV